MTRCWWDDLKLCPSFDEISLEEIVNMEEVNAYIDVLEDENRSDNETDSMERIFNLRRSM